MGDEDLREKLKAAIRPFIAWQGQQGDLNASLAADAAIVVEREHRLAAMRSGGPPQGEDALSEEDQENIKTGEAVMAMAQALVDTGWVRPSGAPRLDLTREEIEAVESWYGPIPALRDVDGADLSALAKLRAFLAPGDDG